MDVVVDTSRSVPGRLARATGVMLVELRRLQRAWKQSLATAFLNPLLYLAAMGLGLGSLVDRGVGTATLGDITYAVYLAPAMLAATAMQTAAMEGAWPIMGGIKWQRTFHAALATPVTVDDLLLGNTMYVLVRVSLSGAAFALVVAALGLAPLGAILLAVVPSLLAAISFGLPMTAFTAHTVQEANLSVVFRFGVIPMFLLSGTFFPVDQLPGSVATIARILPLYHAVELCRWVALGLPPAQPVWVHVVVPLAYAAVGAAVARVTFRRRLTS